VLLTLIVAGVAWAWLHQSQLPDLVAWAGFVREVAIAFGIVAGISKLGSVATDAVAGLKAKGAPPCPPAQG